MNRPACFAIVPAAGGGSRMGAPIAKQYLEVAGQPVIVHTLTRLLSEPCIDRVLLVLSADDSHFAALNYQHPRLDVQWIGGATRAESVANGLAYLQAAEQDWIVVHDAARCCLSADALSRLLTSLQDDAVGGLLALPVADTVKKGDADACAVETVPRDQLWLAQTPQMFRHALLQQALQQLDVAITDEASAVERLGYAPRLIVGDAANIKVTYPHDLALAAAILVAQQKGAA